MEKILEVLESDYNRIFNSAWNYFSISYNVNDTELFKIRVENILKQCLGNYHFLILMIHANSQKRGKIYKKFIF
jgi:hypothetical protein